MNIRLITLLALAAAFPGRGDPGIAFRETERSFGTFRLDLIQTTSFTFVNTGDEPLILYGVSTGCPCTSAEFSREPVAPGDSAVLTVRYNGRHRPPGRFSKPLKVRSNASTSLLQIVIHGKAIKG